MKTRSLVFVVLALAAPAVLAGDFGLRAGEYREGGDRFVGAEVLFDAGVLNINPNVEYVIDNDDFTAGTANLDVTLDLVRFNLFTPYVGAGVGLRYVDDEAGPAETDVLGNLIGGVAFRFDFLEPYAQVKYFRTLENDRGADRDDFALTIGLRF